MGCNASSAVVPASPTDSKDDAQRMLWSTLAETKDLSIGEETDQDLSFNSGASIPAVRATTSERV